MTRARLTRTMPITGEPIGWTLWVGSIDRGWRGFPIFRRGFKWRVKGIPSSSLSSRSPSTQ